MDWIRGGETYIHTPDGRFYICRSGAAENLAYTLSDNNALVCTERGDGALERCKAKAEELAQ